MKTSQIIRVVLTVFTIIQAIIILGSAYIFRINDVKSVTSLPPPERVVAMVRLLDSLPEDGRGEALQALATPLLEVSVALQPARRGRAERPSFAPMEQLLSAYQSAFPNRTVTLLASDRPHPFGTVFPFVNRHPTFLELRIPLVSGDQLVLHSRGLLPITVFGWPIGFGAGIAGTLIALAMLVFLYRQIKPLEELAEAVEKSDFTSNPQPISEVRSSAPEIRALARAFNRQQDRLSKLLDSRLALVGGIQHDVRTFATKLRLRLEGADDPKIAEQATSDLDDIVRLLDDALLATQGTFSVLEPELELVEIEELLRVEMETRDGRVKGPIMDAEDSPATSVYVLGDRLALRRIFANLIDNALAYGERAEILLVSSPDLVTIFVDDDGPGIPEKDRETVLEPFVRLDPSRARKTGGAGLGLAIVTRLIKQHEGHFEILASPLGGARMQVELPRFRTDISEDVRA